MRTYVPYKHADATGSRNLDTAAFLQTKDRWIGDDLVGGMLVPEGQETRARPTSIICLKSSFYMVSNSPLLSLRGTPYMDGEQELEIFQAVRLREAIKVKNVKNLSSEFVQKFSNKSSMAQRRGVSPRNAVRTEKDLPAGSLLLKSFNGAMKASPWCALTPQEQEFQNLMRVGISPDFNGLSFEDAYLSASNAFVFVSSLHPDLFKQKEIMNGVWGRHNPTTIAHMEDLGALDAVSFKDKSDRAN